MSPVQSETGAEPVGIDFRCQTCRGAGELYYQTCGHQGNCPCGEYEAFECEDCGGTGVVICADCGEHPATEVSTDKRLLCRECWPAATLCDLCYRPIAEGWTIPLCARCIATGTAIGRQMAEDERFARDYGRDDSSDAILSYIRENATNG